MVQIEHLKVGSLEIRVERKKIKNMYLRIKPSGEIVVSAHPDISLDDIARFIKAKQSWIKQKQTKIQEAPTNTLKEDEILFLGKTYKCVRNFGLKVEVVIEGDELVVYAPSGLSDEKVVQEIEKWLFKQLKLKIKEYHNKYWPLFEKIGFQPIEIKFRQMKSTWGVCRPTRGSITYNKQLIHQPEEFIEYVVVHELCHLVQADHSSKFYEAVAALLPQWKEYSKRKV